MAALGAAVHALPAVKRAPSPTSRLGPRRTQPTLHKIPDFPSKSTILTFVNPAESKIILAIQFQIA